MSIQKVKVNTMLNAFEKWCVIFAVPYIISECEINIVSDFGTLDSNMKFNATISIIEPPHDKTNNVAVRSAKTQISLGIRPVWSESSLSAWRKVGSLSTHWTQSKGSNQTGRMPRFIWVFVVRIATLLVLSWDGSYTEKNYQKQNKTTQYKQNAVDFNLALFLSTEKSESKSINDQAEQMEASSLGYWMIPYGRKWGSVVSKSGNSHFCVCVGGGGGGAGG